MVGLQKAFTARNLSAGWLCFYIHLVTEIICFFCLTKQTGDSAFVWFFPFTYDALAFVPQSLIGSLNDKYPKCNFNLVGIGLMAAAGLLFWHGWIANRYIPLVILCIGNCFVHVGSAQVTLRCSEGALAHPAVFVAGGSFGVVTGRLLAQSFVPYWIVILLLLSAVPFALLADTYKPEDKAENPCKGFDYCKKAPVAVLIAVSVLIVAVRGYMGYGIPTTWKKTVMQTVFLYVAMGVGKALGGLLADAWGVKRVALLSTGLALPFLLLGDNRMYISLLGVMLFSMTMSITLAMLVSVLPQNPGLAFGYTTIGLFLGTAPIFFFKFITPLANGISLSVLTVLCFVLMALFIRKDVKRDGLC